MKDLIASTLPALVLSFLMGVPAPARATEPRALGGPTPTIWQLKRPKAGEWLGIYLVGHKAGYEFSQLRRETVDGKSVAIAVEDTTIRATVGSNTVSRRVREVKTYAARPHGPLLELKALHQGDGGDVEITVRFDASGGHVTQVAKGQAPQHSEIPPSRDVLENADAARLVAASHRPMQVALFDSTSMTDKIYTLTDDGPGELRAGGSSAQVERISMVEAAEKISIQTAIAQSDGRILETRFGALLAVPESEKLAHALDTVDLFALTRVDVATALPSGIVPETVVYEVNGLPENFRPESNRQSYRALSDGAVAMTVSAAPPTTHASRPATAPASDLVATPAIESKDPAIQALAKEIVDGEADAYAAALKLNHWVYGHLKKAYGVSSDRATDVLRRREGDCTEHSLLMTSLARAVGIPARLVHGLVYSQGSDGKPGLFWHEWVEVFAGDWIAIDPTFDQDVADATHLQMGKDDQFGAVALMGQLKISVLSMSATPSAKEMPHAK